MSQSPPAHLPPNTKADVPVPDEIRGDNLTARVLRQKVWRQANVLNDWCMFVIVGREGSGKSGTCLSMLEKCDPSFSAERVHFDPADFLEHINSIDKDERQGKAMMLDESGVGMGVRSWHDKSQVDLNKTLQTARDDNMIIGMTLPRLSELDSQTRGRLHGFLEMAELSPGEYAKFRWKNVSPTRDDRDKLYYKYPRMEVNGRKHKVKFLAIGPPGEELLEEYEERKAAFKKELYGDTVASLRGEDPDAEEEKTPKEIAEEIAEAGVPDDYVSVHNGNGSRYIDGDLLRMEHDLSVRDAKLVKKLLERNPDVNLE